MSEWLNKTKPRSEPVRVKDVRFVCEHDGHVEQQFKKLVLPLANRDPTLKSAYLVVVEYPDSPGLHVAMCLDADQESPDLVRAISAEFHQMFSTSQTLDILFLSAEQQRTISSVSMPFFQRGPAKG